MSPENHVEDYSQDTCIVTEADGPACLKAQRGYDIIFFDLDGTLLSMDTSEFMAHYMGKLTKHCDLLGYDTKMAQKALMEGIGAMAKDDSATPNDQVFWATFNKSMGLDSQSAEYQAVQDMFLSFYENEFQTIGEIAQPQEDIVQSVALLKAKGYRMAVATMPMFPLVAVRSRIRWAGLDPDDFEFVTDYESAASVKPKPAFFQECLDRAGVQAEHALMVGNNNREDGASTLLGMDLYLITDHLIKQQGGVELSKTQHGTCADFKCFVESLPALK